jgi:hypothetical protein
MVARLTLKANNGLKLHEREIECWYRAVISYFRQKNCVFFSEEEIFAFCSRRENFKPHWDLWNWS